MCPPPATCGTTFPGRRPICVVVVDAQRGREQIKTTCLEDAVDVVEVVESEVREVDEVETVDVEVVVTPWVWTGPKETDGMVADGG